MEKFSEKEKKKESIFFTQKLGVEDAPPKVDSSTVLESKTRPSRRRGPNTIETLRVGKSDSIE